MSTELDELEEIDLSNHSTASPKSRRAGRKFATATRTRTARRPLWQRQLAAEKAWAPKHKPKVT